MKLSYYWGMKKRTIFSIITVAVAAIAVAVVARIRSKSKK